jgi:uncharacterized protein (DUF849 family)
MGVEERLQPALQLKPEVASLNMGSMNFGLYEMLDRFKRLQARLGTALPRRKRRPHLPQHLPRHRAHPAIVQRENGTRFEIECYDIGHLYTAAHFLDRGLLKAPIFIQSVFGLRGGIGNATRRRAAHEAHRRPPVRRRLLLVGAGRRSQPDPDGPMSAAMGGNVRVGLEDSLWDGPGKLAASNADQVKRIRTVIEALGGRVATPDEAREMLALKGYFSFIVSFLFHSKKMVPDDVISPPVHPFFTRLAVSL